MDVYLGQIHVLLLAGERQQPLLNDKQKCHHRDLIVDCLYI